MCVIDEYAIIDRKFVWFIPIRPPVSAFMVARIIIIEIDEYDRMNAMIISGANFLSSW